MSEPRFWRDKFGRRSTPCHRLWRGSAKGGKSLEKLMTYTVYIIENQDGRHYIGYTANLEIRIKDHNTNKTRWTKKKVLGI